MYNLLIDIYVSMISSILGVSLKDIRKVLRKEKLKNEGKSEISDSIDVVSKNLEESKIIIEEALLEMEKQKERGKVRRGGGGGTGL